MSWGQLAESLEPARASAAVREPARASSRPNHLLAIDALGDFWGYGGDMIPPTRAEAMSVPAMARCRHVVCTAARLPLVIDPPDYRLGNLIRQPDPARTRVAVLTDTLDSILFHGWALWRVTARYAGPKGKPGRPHSAEFVALHRHTEDERGHRIDDKPVSESELIWFQGPHEGVLNFAGRALRAAVSFDRAYATTAHSPTPAWELHQTSNDVLTDIEVDTLVTNALDAVRDHGVLFTNAALELRAHGASVENLLISGRNAAAVDIARIVGLPAPVIDAYPAGSSSSYNNVQSRLKEARDIGADAYAAAISERLSMDDVLPQGVTCAFDWDPLLRQDFKERMEGYQAAQDAGVYTADECRAMETGPAKEGPQ